MTAGDSVSGGSRRAKVYGLLYVDQAEQNNLDLPRGSALDIYLRCAVTCAKSAAAAGEDYTLITNAPEQIGRLLARLPYPELQLNEIAFDLQTPKGIRYYHSHFKIAVIDAMASGVFGEQPTLIDLDTVVQRAFSSRLAGLDLVAYDITAKAAHCLHDLALMLGNGAGGWWAGGELIGGSPAGLKRLAAGVHALLPQYFARIDRFIHVGDETVVSAAMNVMSRAGAAIADAGKLGLIARWHSSRTFIPQQTFAQIAGAAILHLPADKLFLARFADRPFALDEFRAQYHAHLRRKLLPRHMLHPVLNQLSGRKHMPRVA
jgi:hypothetical protein